MQFNVQAVHAAAGFCLLRQWYHCTLHGLYIAAAVAAAATSCRCSARAGAPLVMKCEAIAALHSGRVLQGQSLCEGAAAVAMHSWLARLELGDQSGAVGIICVGYCGMGGRRVLTCHAGQAELTPLQAGWQWCML
jgi:hypothetical protein